MIIYWMFLLSGASALVYEVAWVRSLSLVFGASHPAVTTVLSVFMAGLALGGYFLGRRVDTLRRPLRTYGLLEIGIAASAGMFILLLAVYPVVYIPLARGADARPLYLTFLRVVFAAIAMIVPTTLMGGTLPLLVRFVSERSSRVGASLSFLYAMNTLGAVAGTLSAGFLLLPRIGLNATLGTAIGTNLFVGIAAVALQGRASFRAPPESSLQGTGEGSPPKRPGSSEPEGPAPDRDRSILRAALWGIAISGFCALGYEVLWTRILSIVIGTSVYSFSVMLAAFLSGIAMGSQSYGLVQRFSGRNADRIGISVAALGLVQIVIGVVALVVTGYLRDLPAQVIRIRNVFLGTKISEFDFRQVANFVAAFAFMFVPAFFMGVAFPLAGKIHVRCRRAIGGAVGEVAAYNTVGAVLGAAVSGFVLVYLFGIERSLQLLSVLNIGAGAWIASTLPGRRLLPRVVVGLCSAVILALALQPGWGRMWNEKYFAIYRNNQREAFDTPEEIRDALANTDVLFYHEGINETISVIRPRGGSQALLVNGKVVASSTRQDRQCQFTLGHLPMLLHRNPRKVWVLGMGTGMTAGATSVHTGVEDVTLLEIERHVIDGARTFGAWNHDVADSPRLKIVINDGRNFLLTTETRYDVITADPIHPWTRGAASLYTTEYYRIAAERLRPGGIMCQWVPIYELTVADLKSIVKTFGENFRYMMLWLTHYDAEMIGSNDPILIDEAELARRIRSNRDVSADLESVEMGSAADFLSYFVMGTRGLRAFGRDGVVNTDDNLHLEFSAPRSKGKGSLMGSNVEALARYRESILPYLVPAKGDAERAGRRRRWERRMRAAGIYDRMHSLFLWDRYQTGEYGVLAAMLENRYPGYAPGRYLKREYLDQMSRKPRLLRDASFPLLSKSGKRRVVEISAVMVRVGEKRAALMFVDNRAREIYGQLYLDGAGGELEMRIRRIADEVMGELERAYRKEAAAAVGDGRTLPLSPVVSGRFRAVIASNLHRYSAGRGDAR